MKKIIFIFFCFSILSCKKTPFDYRNKFTGNYNFTIQEHSVYGIFPVTVHDTTYTNEGKIEIGSDENDVLISPQNISLQATIYEDGTLSGYYNNNGKGEFSSTKEMKYTFGNYSPGGSTTFTITGTKE